MANIKITDLIAATALGGAELFECVQSATSVKASATQIKNFANDSVTISNGTISSVTISNATGSFDSVTITAGTVPFDTITGRAYGEFKSLRDQTAVSANVAYVAEFDSVAAFNTGITLASSSNITVAAAGVYELVFSAQIDNTDNNDHDITFWYAVDGSDVADSASRVTIPKSSDGGKAVFEITLQEQLSANQYVQIKYGVENIATKLDYTAASAPYPGIPSIIAGIKRIG
jgi:hypothetical protein